MLMDKLRISRAFYKNFNTSNPVSPNVFCADPTAIEYNGRVYIYGSNDQQQFRTVGTMGKNTYEFIHSIVCFSSVDLTNWTFHGEIDVKKIAPWSVCAFAPSVIYRKEEDGLDHFYMYFSNTGEGIGVLTATNPEGPWTDACGKALIWAGMPGLEKCPHPFDPGVCLDNNGVGYLVFGGGMAPDGDDSLPGTARIVRLGKDLISFDSDFVEIKAPYFFESSDINFINDTFVYTFNNSWEQRKFWPYDCEPSAECSMSYMTSKNPLETESWKYCGYYFKNPGEQGLNYSNNHTHIFSFKNEWYIVYHTLTLQENTPYIGGFRSICIDKMPSVPMVNGMIEKVCGTRNGVAPVGELCGKEVVLGTTMFTCAEVECVTEGAEVYSKALADGSWMLVKKVGGGEAKSVEMLVKGHGFIEVRFDKITSEPISEVQIDSEEFIFVNTDLNFSSKHDIFFIFSNKDISIRSWQLK